MKPPRSSSRRRVVVGLADNQFSQLISGDIKPGQQVVTSIIVPLTTQQRNAQNPLFGGGRGNFGGMQPGGGRGGDAGGGNQGGGNRGGGNIGFGNPAAVAAAVVAAGAATSAAFHPHPGSYLWPSSSQ